MASKLEDQVAGYIGIFLSNNYPDMFFEREVPGDFGLRYDFVIPTTPPICIEVDGENHRSYNDFFFKTTDDFDHYKSNDNMRQRLHNAQEIILVRVPDNKKWTYSKFAALLKEHEPILDKGLSARAIKEKEEKDKRIKFFSKKKEERKEKEKEIRKEQYKKQKEYTPSIDEEYKKKQEKYRKEQLEKQREYRKKQYREQKEKQKNKEEP